MSVASRNPGAAAVVADQIRRSQKVDANGNSCAVVEGVGVVVKKAAKFVVIISAGVNRMFDNLIELINHILLARGYS